MRRLAANTLLMIFLAGLFAPVALAALPAATDHCERQAAAQQPQHHHCAASTAPAPASTSNMRAGMQQHCRHSCCLGMTARTAGKSVPSSAANTALDSTHTLVCENLQSSTPSTQIRLIPERAPPSNLL